jgi:hypothetical protein
LPLDIELFGNLLPGEPRRRTMTLPGPATAGDLARLLGLEPDAAGLIVINGIQSEPEDALPEDGRVCFFPYLSGG